MWFSAQTFGNGEMIRNLTPLTSDEARQYARTARPLKASTGDGSQPEPRIEPTDEQIQEYQHLRHRVAEWNEGRNGQIPGGLYRQISRKVEDYRCNNDWRDRIVKDKLGRKGLVSAFGDPVLPTAFHEIPERYASINCLIPYIPVVRDGRYALASTKDAEISEGALATPYEYDDAFLLPFSNGRLYAVRKGERWRILSPLPVHPYNGIEPLCDYIIDRIYPLISSRDGEVIAWPFEADGRFGIIMLHRYIAPDFDDFRMDYESGVIDLINNGSVVKTIDINEELPF